MKKRPFIGVVITIHAVDFFAPLTSPKQKHERMHDQMDFIKMDYGRLGAINLNNMIPVADSLYHKVALERKEHDSPAICEYKQLLRRQSEWCNLHQAMILDAAANLYRKIILNEAPEAIRLRCCDFYHDMLLMKEYCQQIPAFAKDSVIRDIEEQREWLSLSFYRADQFYMMLR